MRGQQLQLKSCLSINERDLDEDDDEDDDEDAMTCSSLPYQAMQHKDCLSISTSELGCGPALGSSESTVNV